GNAFKFTPSGGSIRIEIVPREKDLLVHVIDNGKGMDKIQMSALFQKFATMGGNYLTKENIQGTGLGLYISKSLVELHGGK
ncbi:sensor histidine kinase, partial [Klebsiella pneumoniae]|uniref:sensor histidine kinase n=1 Tax=Klebsiella pneumoniae TaxID=573 RepID=UPI003C6CE632